MTASRGFRPWWFLIGALVVALVHPVSTAAWTSNSFSARAEAALLRLTNEARIEAGLAPLPQDPLLNLEARARSRDMIVRGYFSHEIPPDGRRHRDELAALGGCFVRTGENIGWNEAPDGTATRDVHYAFMASASHRALVLTPAWQAIGIGVFQGSTDRKMWTVLFGIPCRVPAPAAAAVTPAAAVGSAATGAASPGPRVDAPPQAASGRRAPGPPLSAPASPPMPTIAELQPGARAQVDLPAVRPLAAPTASPGIPGSGSDQGASTPGRGHSGSLLDQLLTALVGLGFALVRGAMPAGIGGA